MTYNEYAFLASEKTTLETLLAELPAANVIDRWSLQARLEEVREELREWQENASRSTENGNGESTQYQAVQ